MKEGYSIVIPNLNSPVVGKTVEAILQQMKGNFEVIVVGKDDKKILKENKKVRFFRTRQKKSPAEARNIGIGKARHENIVFMDADCIPRQGYFEKLLGNRNEIVLGSLDFDAKNFWTSCDNFSHFYSIAKTMPRREMPFFGTMQLKIPKKILAEAGLFDESLVTGEDLDLSIRLKKAGHKFFFEPDATVSHLPERKSFASMLNHSKSWAQNSMGVRVKHMEFLKLPGFLANRFVLLALSPLISLWVTAKIYTHLPNMRFIHFAPFVYLSKIYWCIGAFQGLKK